MLNLRTVDLNLLVVFDALMQERHLSRAAERIGLTSPRRRARWAGSGACSTTSAGPRRRRRRIEGHALHHHRRIPGTGLPAPRI